jgi:osmotically inducible protein OsmC
VSAFERSAEVVWEGALEDGNGTASATSSGAFGDLAVTWSSRVEQAGGRTSPEELLAASHAACFAMAFSNVLGSGGHDPERLQVRAVVSAELGEGGLSVTSSTIDVTGRVAGIDEAAFEAAAEEAERNCPISNALRGNLDIRVHARLES